MTGSSVSSIDGLLSGTGSVFLLNPNGIVIGSGGVVDVGGSFVASTLDVSNDGFMAGGDLTFSGSSNAAVINYGSIGALGGDVALIGARVENHGSINAPNGTAALAAGHEVLMRDAALADGKFMVQVGGPDKPAGLSESKMLTPDEVAELRRTAKERTAFGKTAFKGRKVDLGGSR